MGFLQSHKEALSQIVGSGGVVPPDALEGLLCEWRNRAHGTTPLALAPSSTAALCDIMRYCYAHDIAVVPQGGNTGLVGGQTPHGQVLIILKRLNRIRSVMADNFSLIAEAGVTLQQAQQTAAEADRLFPLSIGSEGSCQIGGIISTNAGGVNVLRYGNMRDLVLGLEVVLPDGTIWHNLETLRKNNTGYDLKQLFIGGEGTLGIISAASLKLFPRPAEKVTAYCAVGNAEAAVKLLSLAQQRTGGQITSFELISENAQNLTTQNIAAARAPLGTAAAYYVLLEGSAGTRNTLPPIMEALLAEALTQGLISDATLAANEGQTKALWLLRHEISAAMRSEGVAFKGDISIPITKVPAFLEAADAAVANIASGARVISFGHLGDGNIHYDVIRPAGASKNHLEKVLPPLKTAILDCAMSLGGSFSAEHGIGAFKREDLLSRKDSTSLDLMRSIKAALDPKGLMNPGKML